MLGWEASRDSVQESGEQVVIALSVRGVYIGSWAQAPLRSSLAFDLSIHVVIPNCTGIFFSLE